MGSLFRNFKPRPHVSLMTFLCLSLCSTALSSDPLKTNEDDKPTAYEVLEEYDFPPGLLPKGVVGYELDNTTGKFSAYLNGSCSFSLEDSYQLKYKSTLKGYISQGKLRDLQGITVKVLLFWVDIVEVVRRGEELEFSVGIASANFAVDNFVEIPQCGCGFDCVNVEVRKIRSNSFVDFFLEKLN